MAKMNGTLLLTEAQIKRLAKGKPVRITRDKQHILLGVKATVDARFALRLKIKKLREQLRSI